MTLDELERTMPTGLHDALLYGFRVDCMSMKLVLDVDVYDYPRDPFLRTAVVTLLGLLTFEFDPPRPAIPFDDRGVVYIDSREIETLSKRPRSVLNPLPQGAYANYIFLSEWESFIYVTARDAKLDWAAPDWRPHDVEYREGPPKIDEGAITLDELERTLPSGFRNARLSGFRIDSKEMQLVLDLEVAKSATEPSTPRPARVTLSGLLTFEFDPRRVGVPLPEVGSLSIATGHIGQADLPVTSVPDPLPPGAFANFIFLREWDAYIYVTARAARLEWIEQSASLRR